MLCQEMNDFHFLSQESCMTGAFACFQSGLRTCFAITYRLQHYPIFQQKAIHTYQQNITCKSVYYYNKKTATRLSSLIPDINTFFLLHTHFFSLLVYHVPILSCNPTVYTLCTVSTWGSVYVSQNQSRTGDQRAANSHSLLLAS